ncbi:TetR/AcrR family transcriptional regulator [Actinoplanes sp. NPDC023714]|uniref:TetR/AcrR family transcriptional regulator n=1 Tax=Actinoplanes sp. NPDC023714 TaxID=3154322 RepID=UPI0033FC8621
MPRGVAVPEARQHLFAALERVMAADGALTSRNVTQEAGLATGLLFTHFRSFDGFLTAYAVDRSFQIAAALAPLATTFGHGVVAENLTEAILALPRASVLTVTRLTAFRPSLTAEVARVLGGESAGLNAIVHAVDRHLRAEQELGRVAAEADTSSLALAVAGVLQHVALTDDGHAEERVRRALTALAPALAERP